MGQYINIDPSTGDWVVENGDFKTTDSLQVPAYNRLKCPRGGWLYAPNPVYGSTFNNIRKNLTTKYPAPIENAAANALQPITDSGRASRIDVTATNMTRFSVAFDTVIYQSSNKVEEFTIPGI